MSIPKILIVITYEPADKAQDGTMTTGFVREVYANLPARYFDIVVKDWEVTERDEDGAVAGMTCDPAHPNGEAPFLVMTDLPDEADEEQDLRARGRYPDAEEWTVLFWNAGDVQRALVLRAPDVIAAAQRVKDEFPSCEIISITVSEATQEGHPMAFLDENEIILPVGGPRLPKAPESTQ
jgi:hypothetical protein